ncbi:hypothetical protein HELRODRAFT_167757 [Helobdella robusta]|uniref:Uncharacterized protein n=1 Tax=Helobdella robusta TaxID=6412 RepID=T1EZR7_HELRO|nr:hypothetical protein HELRODRAFT_167757 [Helobdella robusta]ESO09932.1 hypothetical protein HELRODRAFT_167757 [Helobdella robusta]
MISFLNMNIIFMFIILHLIPLFTTFSTKQNWKNETAKDTNLDDQLEAMLHGGELHVHDNKPQHETTEEKSKFPDMAEQLDALLHGGEEHVHSGKHRSFEPANDKIPFGTFDQEAVLHGGDAHVHSRTTISNKEPNEEVVGAADPEHILHGEKVHGRHEKLKTTTKHDDDGVNHNVDNELEALLHGGDGHVHERNDRTTTDAVEFKVANPEHMLHESAYDPHQHEQELEEQAADGSRPLQEFDPTVVQHEPQEIKATIGTMNEVDYLDYKKWKKGKKKASSWLNGFSYMSDKLLYNFNSIKQRLFGSDNIKNDTIKHDEP